MFARFLIRLFDQRIHREGFVRNHAVPREEPHLIDQTRHALHAIRQRRIERRAEFGVLIFIRQQLLVGRERHHRVADLVCEAVGHGANKAQIGSLDFEPLQLLALREILDHQQC